MHCHAIPICEAPILQKPISLDWSSAHIHCIADTLQRFHAKWSIKAIFENWSRKLSSTFSYSFQQLVWTRTKDEMVNWCIIQHFHICIVWSIWELIYHLSAQQLICELIYHLSAEQLTSASLHCICELIIIYLVNS